MDQIKAWKDRNSRLAQTETMFNSVNNSKKIAFFHPFFNCISLPLKPVFLLQVLMPAVPDRVVLNNLSRADAGLYVCTADNRVTEGVEKITKIIVRRESAG